MITTRPERPTDIAEVRRVHEAAFGRKAEAALVDLLRCARALEVSLVACQDSTIVGHIVFSPVRIDPQSSTVIALGLGPISVLPSCQGTGVGARLIKAGLDKCRAAGCGLVFVLGDPAYYGRFGFTAAVSHGLTWEQEAPAEAFMVKQLKDGALAAVQGNVSYRPEFDAV